MDIEYTLLANFLFFIENCQEVRKFENGKTQLSYSG